MLYLSQCIGRPVLDRGDEPIGKVADLVVAIGDRYPPVTGLVVATERRQIFLHWGAVERFDLGGARLRTLKIDIGRFRRRPNEILLKGDLLDRQIVDLEGRKVIRVNDVGLDEVEGSLHVVAVDVGASGLLRRLGVERPWRAVSGRLGLPLPERYIDWEDVDPLESTIASVRLRVPHARLSALHPADLAQIIDKLTPRDRAGVLASLDDEAVADAIEEMEPETQVEVLEDLEPARAADILEEMSPDDAADLVADLPEGSRDEILALMEQDEAAEVRELLTYPEDSAGGLMTTAYVAIPATLTAAETIDRLRELEPDAETIYYVYVVDADEHLVGVLSLRDLIVARPDSPIPEVMIEDPIAVGILDDARSVAETIAHYNLLAVPVVDDEGRLQGIVTVDDAIDTVAPSAWRRRLPRVFDRSESGPGETAGTPAAGPRPGGGREPGG
jgi:CBS domain-containing protein